MSNGIFRKVSLERLSSPEQLDQLFSVTTPRAWIALIAVGCILATSLFWGILGTVPVRVNGQGIIIKSFGVYNITHTEGGQITDVRVAVGDVVKRGDVVARIDRPDLVGQINDLKTELEHQQFAATKAINIYETEEKIKKLQDDLNLKTEVVSRVDGRVLEVQARRGDIIQPGANLVSLERMGNTVKLEVILYVKAEDGKNIMPGMEAQISPSTVKKEEYGFMLGRVVSVSEYPATAQGMMTSLGSKELVSRLSGEGAPLEVRIDVITDESTVSGYKWSSSKGPPLKINSGTLCAGTVTISELRPISMVIPMVKKALSIY